LVESYRNAYDRVCHRTLLNIGFTDLTPDQMVEIQRRLSDRAMGRPNIFESDDAVIDVQVDRLWNELFFRETGDTPTQIQKKQVSNINTDSMQHRYVREMEGEWLCYQAVKELGIDGYLKSLGWGENHIGPLSIPHG